MERRTTWQTRWRPSFVLGGFSWETGRKGAKEKRQKNKVCTKIKNQSKSKIERRRNGEVRQSAARERDGGGVGEAGPGLGSGQRHGQQQQWRRLVTGASLVPERGGRNMSGRTGASDQLTAAMTGQLEIEGDCERASRGWRAGRQPGSREEEEGKEAGRSW